MLEQDILLELQLQLWSTVVYVCLQVPLHTKRKVQLRTFQLINDRLLRYGWTLG